MTDAIDREQRRDQMLSRQRATADLLDIAALRAQPATDRYLLRRVQEIRDGHAAAVLDDNSLSTEEREIRRRLYLAFADFSRIMDSDEAAHRASLSLNPPDYESSGGGAT